MFQFVAHKTDGIKKATALRSLRNVFAGKLQHFLDWGRFLFVHLDKKRGTMSQVEENYHEQLEAQYRSAIQAASPFWEKRICVACEKKQKCR